MGTVPFEAYLEHLSFILLLILLAPFYGAYLVRVFENKNLHFLKKIEAYCYRLCGINCLEEMTWIQYTKALLAFNFMGLLLLFLLLIYQERLPWNPQTFPNVSAALAFNIAASFV